MKATYLIYKQIDGVQKLAVATQEEWDIILKENRMLPLEHRRRFINDCIKDGNELDCIFTEVSTKEHQKWNSKNTVYQRKRKAGKRYTHISLDTGVSDTSVQSLHESIPSGYNLEMLVEDQVLMEQLRQALRAWQPWAEELLKLYMAGEKRSCTNELSKRHHLSDRTIQRRKNAFEKFVLDFLQK